LNGRCDSGASRKSGWQQAGLDQQSSVLNTAWVVDIQNDDGCPANRSFASENRPTPKEAIAPPVAPRIEQPLQRIGQRVIASDI
jgi:hypothetical protein